MSTAIETAVEKVKVKWDTCDNSQALAKDLKAENPELTDDEAFSRACEGEDYHQQCWDDMIDDLQDVLDTFNPDGRWYVTGRNMGWQHQSGFVPPFLCHKALEFLQKILPHTSEYSFELTVEADELSMTIWHHDAPTGEYRTIVKALECDTCGKLFAPDNVVLVDGDGEEKLAFCKSCHEQKVQEQQEEAEQAAAEAAMDAAEDAGEHTRCHQCRDTWKTRDMVQHEDGHWYCPVCDAIS